MATSPKPPPRSAFFLDWDPDALLKCVEAINVQDPAKAPAWLRTPPPLVTITSLQNNILGVLDTVADNRVGRMIYSPVSPDQIMAFGAKLINLQNDDFMQAVAEHAFLQVTASVSAHTLIARTAHFADNSVQIGVMNNLPAPERKERRSVACSASSATKLLLRVCIASSLHQQINVSQQRTYYFEVVCGFAWKMDAPREYSTAITVSIALILRWSNVGSTTCPGQYRSGVAASTTMAHFHFW